MDTLDPSKAPPRGARFQPLFGGAKIFSKLRGGGLCLGILKIRIRRDRGEYGGKGTENKGREARGKQPSLLVWLDSVWLGLGLGGGWDGLRSLVLASLLFSRLRDSKKFYLGSLSILCYGTSLEKRLTTWPRRFSGHE